MAAGYTELFLEQGTTFQSSITLDGVSGEPYDLTGFIAKSQIRKSYYSTSPTAEFSVTINQPPTSGIIVLNLTAAQTANVAPGRYVYDVLIRDNPGTVTRVLEGIVNVSPRVTIL